MGLYIWCRLFPVCIRYIEKSFNGSGLLSLVLPVNKQSARSRILALPQIQIFLIFSFQSLLDYATTRGEGMLWVYDFVI